jgi:hypothetical protein
MFLDSRREENPFWTEWQQALLEFNLLLIFSWIKFWFITVLSLNTLNTPEFVIEAQ